MTLPRSPGADTVRLQVTDPAAPRLAGAEGDARRSVGGLPNTCLAGTATGVTADQALAELLSGNLRYIGQQPHMAHRTAERRAEIAPGQHPIAVVVCCSDSRVPPEVVFDQGLGDLFVVRQAGGTVGGLALGSIVYGVTHLRAPLVVVLGHSRCGAITAVVDGREATGHLGKVLAAIRPSVEQARALGGDLVETAVRAHTQRTVALLRDNTELAALEQTRTLKITGAHYDLVTGLVTLVP